MSVPQPVVVDFKVESNPATVLTVTGADGARYEVRLAMILTQVADSGIKNPLDNMPIFNIAAATATHVTRKTDG